MDNFLIASAVVFVICMIILGGLHFFGSDYAQRKWNPDYDNDSKS